MFLIYAIFIVIPFVTSNSYDDEISYRSSVMEDKRPILRMPVMSESEEYEEGTDRREGKSTEYTETTENARPVRDLTLLVHWLIDKFGYDVPQGRKNNDDFMEPGIKIPVLHAQSDENEETTPKPAELEKGNFTSLITLAKLKKQNKEKLEPLWVTDLKDFIKDLTTKFGEQDVAQYTKPIIASLEKKHHVQIRDIDRNVLCEIFINYVPTKSSKKRERSEGRVMRYKSKHNRPKPKLNYENSG
ncbi:unnamed protein product [Spodoptera littoralis]|uniref:Uncharacterized protein n=1 Tax=Spodoptera littoralis TaxID=7109 RepID=A0A9P0N4U7_SPOLI|nr:unnamed protein product [Spodoptera littoralis]CAH1641565.1 unnamed protein product [Spodoptera littoralis]